MAPERSCCAAVVVGWLVVAGGCSEVLVGWFSLVWFSFGFAGGCSEAL